MATPRIVFVTGGNNGLGYETVKALFKSPRIYNILVGSRSVEKGTLSINTLKNEIPESKSTLELVQLDLTSDDSIEKASEQIKAKYGKLDTLINNAGVSFDPLFLASKISLRECFTAAYNTNVTGTHILTYTLVPLLLLSPDPRLLFVTGLAAQTVAAKKYFPTPPQPAGWPKKIAFETIGYRCSKTALNMLMLDWNHKLKADGVKVWGCGPGMLSTDLGGLGKEFCERMGCQPASVGAEFLRDVVEGKRDGDVGKLINKDGYSEY